MDGTFDRPRDDFLRAMDGSCVLENSMTQQRPVLHQAKHLSVPPESAADFRGSFARIDAKSSARKARRKWPARKASGRALLVTLAALLLACRMMPVVAAKIPLPKP